MVNILRNMLAVVVMVALTLLGEAHDVCASENPFEKNNWNISETNNQLQYNNKKLILNLDEEKINKKNSRREPRDASILQNNSSTQEKPLRLILSIDGGGIRGLLPAMILEWLELELSKAIQQHHLNAPPAEIRVGECFDLFAGTSTGGLISLGLNVPLQGRPKFSVQTFVKLYEEKGSFIFPKKGKLSQVMSVKFDPKPLENVLQSYFGELTLRDLLKPTFITACDIQGENLMVFNSREACKSQAYNYKLKKVARATSAAPTYLPAITMCNEAENPTYHTFIDGGVTANNPTMLLYLEAQELYPNSRFHVISLGCGASSLFTLKSKKSGGMLQWAPNIADVLMTTASRMTHNLVAKMATLRRDEYTRVQFDLDQKVSQMDNTTTSNINNLKGYVKREIANKTSNVHRIKETILNFYKKREFYIHYKLIDFLNQQIKEQSQILDFSGKNLSHRSLWEAADYVSKKKYNFTKLLLDGSKLDEFMISLLPCFGKALQGLSLKNTQFTLDLLKTLKNICHKLTWVDLRDNPKFNRLQTGTWLNLMMSFKNGVIADAKVFCKLGLYWESQQDYNKALNFYCQANNVEAQLSRARILRIPTYNAPEKLNNAWNIYQKLANQGDKEAQYLLGCFYLTTNKEEKTLLIQKGYLSSFGRDTIHKAAYWFELAAKQLHKRAAYTMAEYYERGQLKAESHQGATLDERHQIGMAIQYYKLAKKAGSQSAHGRISNLLKRLEKLHK